MLPFTLISQTVINKILLNKSTINTVTKQFIRAQGTKQNPFNSDRNKNSRSTLYYAAASGVLFIGFTYAAVPLYRMFCQVNFISLLIFIFIPIFIEIIGI